MAETTCAATVTLDRPAARNGYPVRMAGELDEDLPPHLPWLEQ